MTLYPLLSQSRQFIKVFKNSIIDGTDKIENVNSINVTPQISRRMNMQFIKVLKYSIIDGADNIENVCSIDVTYWISRGITVCSPPV